MDFLKNMMPVYLDQLGQRVGAFFFLVMERRDPAEPSKSVNCAFETRLFFLFFNPMSPNIWICAGPELLCCTQKVWSLESKDVMSCPHMKVVWGGERRGGGGRRVGMEMQSD